MENIVTRKLSPIIFFHITYPKSLGLKYENFKHPNCSCIEGYYGEPRLGYDIPCRPCPCPGSEDSGHSFASRCHLDPRTKDVICECFIGYGGKIMEIPLQLGKRISHK